jgi:hypothetical protein
LQAVEVTEPKALASIQLKPGEVLVEAPTAVIADHVRAVGGAVAVASDQESVRVRGHAVTDPAVLAQFAIPEGEVLVEVRDADLAEQVQSTASSTMTLAEAFQSFRHSAWRLEARDYYVVDEYAAQIQAFQAGRPMPPRTDGWAEVMHGATTRGARVGRVRLVGHPVTDYTRWEFAIYPDNVQLGEDVQIVDRDWLDESWTAAPDVWLFDDHLAFRQRYTDDGVYLGAEQIDAAPVREMRDLLAALAVALHEYRLADIPAPRRASDGIAALPPLCA